MNLSPLPCRKECKYALERERTYLEETFLRCVRNTLTHVSECHKCITSFVFFLPLVPLFSNCFFSLFFVGGGGAVSGERVTALAASISSSAMNGN